MKSSKREDFPYVIKNVEENGVYQGGSELDPV